jgi:hypothetical protein
VPTAHPEALSVVHKSLDSISSGTGISVFHRRFLNSIHLARNPLGIGSQFLFYKIGMRVDQLLTPRPARRYADGRWSVAWC